MTCLIPAAEAGFSAPRILAILGRWMNTPEIQFAALTDVGRQREHNEDNFLVDKKVGLFVVCDGMGGHAAGEVASALAVRTLHEEIKRQADMRSEEHTSELQSQSNLVCRLLLEKKKK